MIVPVVWLTGSLVLSSVLQSSHTGEVNIRDRCILLCLSACCCSHLPVFKFIWLPLPQVVWSALVRASLPSAPGFKIVLLTVKAVHFFWGKYLGSSQLPTSILCSLQSTGHFKQELDEGSQSTYISKQEIQGGLRGVVCQFHQAIPRLMQPDAKQTVGSSVCLQSPTQHHSLQRLHVFVLPSRPEAMSPWVVLEKSGKRLSLLDSKEKHWNL